MKKSGLIFLSLLSIQVFAEEKNLPPVDCSSTKEFITTYNFLKDKKELELKEDKIFEISKSVSKTCTDGAKRFIQSLDFLIDAEIPSKNALLTAKDLAGKSNTVVDNFYNIFKTVYVEKYFDLPAEKALKISTELTFNLDQDPNILIEDFKNLAEFCTEEQGVDLSYATCSDFIHKVLMNSEKFKGSIAQNVILTFEFITTDEKGPKLKVPQALKEIEEISKFGNQSFSNFKDAYEFAISEKGLNLKEDKAISFAKEMAAFTIGTNSKLK